MILSRCYSNSLKLAVEHRLKTVAFPSISTGAYGYPIDQAAHTALEAVAGFLKSHGGELVRVTWVLFDRATYDAYAQALSQ